MGTVLSVEEFTFFCFFFLFFYVLSNFLSFFLDFASDPHSLPQKMKATMFFLGLALVLMVAIVVEAAPPGENEMAEESGHSVLRAAIQKIRPCRDCCYSHKGLFRLTCCATFGVECLIGKMVEKEDM